MKKSSQIIFTLFTLSLAHFSTSASIIPTGLTVTGSIELGHGVAITPGTTQSDTIFSGNNNGFISNLAVTGDTTTDITFTNTNDALGFNTNISSTSVANNTLAYDFGMQLDNTHATDSFLVSFSFDYYHLVSAFVTGYSRSNISLFDSDGEFAFSDRKSDVDYGNSIDGVNTNNFGGVLEDAGVFNFSYTVLAGETINFNGFAEAFFGFSGGHNIIEQQSTGILSISDIRQIKIGQPPVDIPEPSSLIVFLTLLTFFMRIQSKRI
ncbi:hypothetical protein AADZ91_04355 [Colwelliaceae bacterium 6441]